MLLCKYLPRFFPRNIFHKYTKRKAKRRGTYISVCVITSPRFCCCCATFAGFIYMFCTFAPLAFSQLCSFFFCVSAADFIGAISNVNSLKALLLLLLLLPFYLCSLLPANFQQHIKINRKKYTDTRLNQKWVWRGHVRAPRDFTQPAQPFPFSIFHLPTAFSGAGMLANAVSPSAFILGI